MAELDIWLRIIEEQGQAGWLKFWEATFHHPVSDIDSLSTAIKFYGPWPVFEGILAASKKKIAGDPLPYVWSVASAKWSEYRIGDEYERGIERTRRKVAQQNEELEEKLEKARRINESGSI